MRERELSELAVTSSLTERDRQMIEAWVPVCLLAHPQIGEVGARWLLERAILSAGSEDPRERALEWAQLRALIVLEGDGERVRSAFVRRMAGSGGGGEFKMRLRSAGGGGA